MKFAGIYHSLDKSKNVICLILKENAFIFVASETFVCVCVRVCWVRGGVHQFSGLL